MNNELLQIWVDALRSGQFKQGTGTLRNSDDEYCCLGVLCQLSELGTWKARDTGSLEYIINNQQNTSTSYLPKEVATLLNLPEEFIYAYADSAVDIQLPSELLTLKDAGRDFEKLSDLNDTGITFPIIASLIENAFLTPSA